MTYRLPTTTTPGQWCFKIVAALDEREPEVKVLFLGDPSPLLVRTAQDRWSVQQHLSMSLRHALPIAVLFGEDKSVLEVGTVLFAEVLEVGDNPRYPHLRCVELGGEGAPRYLPKQHPRYEEMLRQLTEATATQAPVWCVIQGGTIVDVKVLSREEDDLLCQWMRAHGQPTESVRLETG
jgi:hypothetical protein